MQTVLVVHADAAATDDTAAAVAAAGYIVTGCALLGAAALNAAAALRPDAFVAVAAMPTTDTFGQLAMLTAALPRPVLMFTDDDAETHMKAALRAGVSA